MTDPSLALKRAFADVITIAVQEAVRERLDELTDDEIEQLQQFYDERKPVTECTETRNTGKGCGHCGGAVPQPERGPRGRYCSTACKQAAYRVRRQAG